MKGLVFLGDRKLAFVDVADPTPGVGEVVVEVKASGMCGSDLHYYRAPFDASKRMEQRVIGGHEPCGIVAAVGAGVPAHVARVGQRVGRTGTCPCRRRRDDRCLRPRTGGAVGHAARGCTRSARDRGG